ncbi:MAG: hypothetical protein IT361_00445 [Gemmatimonadaceae bacterium]|nr:hypothetical protein [Gemmatimonadaceae bacterium]
MFVLRIQHAVPDYEGWKRAFDRDPLDRKGSKVRAHRVYRGTDDPNLVFIDLEFDTLADAANMLARLRALWAGPGGAVMRNPEATIVEHADAG